MSSARNILVTDDNRATLRTLSAGLEDMGYRVITAVNGREALVLIRRQAFNIVVADIKLPDINGVKLGKLIREKYPETAILFISG